MKKTTILTLILMSALLLGCNNKDLPLQESASDTESHFETTPDTASDTEASVISEHLWENEELYLDEYGNDYALFNKLSGARIRTYSDYAVLNALEADGSVSQNHLAIGIDEFGSTTVYRLDKENGETAELSFHSGAEFYGDFIIGGDSLFTAKMRSIGSTDRVKPVTVSPRYDDEILFTNDETGITCKFYLSKIDKNNVPVFNTDGCALVTKNKAGSLLCFHGKGENLTSRYFEADIEHMTPSGVYTYERSAPYTTKYKTGPYTVYSFLDGDCLTDSEGKPLLAIRGVFESTGSGEILALAYGRDAVSSLYSKELEPIVESFGTYAYAKNGFMFFQYDRKNTPPEGGTEAAAYENPRLTVYDFDKGLRTITPCDELLYLDEYGALVKYGGKVTLYSPEGDRISDLTPWNDGFVFCGVSYSGSLDGIWYHFTDPSSLDKDSNPLQHEWRYPVMGAVQHSTYYGEPMENDPEYISRDAITVDVRGLDSFNIGEFTYKDYNLYNNGQYVYYFNSYAEPVSFTAGGIDNTFSLTFITEHGNEIVYKFYPELPTCDIPDGAQIVDRYQRSIGDNILYLHDGKYIFCDAETGRNLVLPVDGNIVAARMYYDYAHLVKQQDGVITMIIFEYVRIGDVPHMYVTYELPITPNDTITFGDYQIIDIGYTSHAVRNGIYKRYIGEFGYKIIGNYILFYEGPLSSIGVVYNKALEPIYGDGEFIDFQVLSDGRYIGKKTSTDNKSTALVFDSEGNVVYESASGCMHVGADFIFMLDSDNVLRLYSHEGELLCEFGEMKESYFFHSMLSGKHNKDGEIGYYFVFEDGNDSKEWTQNAQAGEYGNRSFEYYYIPSTGESGTIDNGYAAFAYAKPVLYLYPEEETHVTVTFAHPERLTTVYPTYGDGWSVTAKPDGTLTDARGREYYCLYWEESGKAAFYDFPDGFCVAGEDSAAFLENALSRLGFTDKEANEFIIYWLPILEGSRYNLIRFELTDEREVSNALHISPTPDSLLRMAIHIQPLESEVRIPKQMLPTFERNGFAAVEWGGCVH